MHCLKYPLLVDLYFLQNKIDSEDNFTQNETLIINIQYI